MTHESKWIADKNCWRLVHPDTGDFIAEYYPGNNSLVVTKHRKTSAIGLSSLGPNGEYLITVSKVY